MKKLELKEGIDLTKPIYEQTIDDKYKIVPGYKILEGKEKATALEHMSAADRKARPIARGVLDYFPDALAEVAFVSKIGNDQHNPGQPMHWAKEKSTDHADCILRHLIDRGKYDSDGTRHSAKVAWRALALLQIELDEEAKKAEVKEELTDYEESSVRFRTNDKTLYDNRRRWLNERKFEYSTDVNDENEFIIYILDMTEEEFRELELVT